MAVSAERAVRDYLTSLKNPSALRDEDQLAKLREGLDRSDDELERLQLRQRIIELETPSTDGYENNFVTHAKAWADKTGVSERAFLHEGVPPKVLRKAGFRNVGATKSRTSRASGRSTRTRVSADQVRAAIPKGEFTIKDVQDASGASAAVVRRIVGEEVAAGNVTEVGPDPEYRGRGRAPTIYRR